MMHYGRRPRLTTMHDKQLVIRTAEGRAFRYKPMQSKEAVRAAVVANVLENVFQGDLEALKAAVAGLKAGNRSKVFAFSKRIIS